MWPTGCAPRGPKDFIFLYLVETDESGHDYGWMSEQYLERIRRAVMRVTLRRRVREAYRLTRRELLLPELERTGWGVDIAFVYLDKTPAPYSVIHERMTQLLQRVAAAAAHQQPPVQHQEAE